MHRISLTKKVIWVILLGLILIVSVMVYYEVMKRNATILVGCISLAKEDEKFCDYKLKGCNLTEPYKDYCQEEMICLIDVYELKAIKNNDENICKNLLIIPNGQGDYPMCVAIVKNDIEICANFSDAINKIACEATINKNVDHCSNLKNMQYNDIEYEGAYIKCLDKFYTNMAEITGDINYCNEIKNIENLMKESENKKSLVEHYGKAIAGSYMQCMGAVTQNIKYCNDKTFLCRSSNEKDIFNCYDEIIVKQRK